MTKIYKLTDTKHEGLYVEETAEGYKLIKIKADTQSFSKDTKFYMLPYFIRDTEVYDEYMEVDKVPEDYIENMVKLLAQAEEIATEKHKHQVDKNGQPYIGHVLRVANQLNYVEDKIIALLHDILEDTDTTEEELSQIFPRFIVEAMKSLTRDKEKETYRDFIKRCALNDVAVNIKIADLKDNYNRPMKENNTKLKERYKKALEFLED